MKQDLFGDNSPSCNREDLGTDFLSMEISLWTKIMKSWHYQKNNFRLRFQTDINRIESVPLQKINYNDGK